MDTLRSVLASRLKRLRLSKGLKQAELAEAMGCEVNAISRYETGANAPSIEHLLKMSEALGVSPMEILPPPNAMTQRVLELRLEITEKLLQVGTPEQLEKILSVVDVTLSASQSKR